MSPLLGHCPGGCTHAEPVGVTVAGAAVEAIVPSVGVVAETAAWAAIAIAETAAWAAIAIAETAAWGRQRCA